MTCTDEVIGKRNVTLVTAAHLFLTEQRTCPKAPARA